MDIAVQAHLHGWKFIYLNDIECQCELPKSYKAYRKQQHQWHSEPMQLLCLYLPDIIRSKGETANELKPHKISLSVVSSISEVSSKDWDACVVDVTGPEKHNPYLTHGFLSSLEESGCAVKVSYYHSNICPTQSFVRY